MTSLRRPAAFLLALAAAACGRDGLPDPSSAAYVQAVATFHRGLAAAQVGESGLAMSAFQRVTELAPGEPAAWANLAVVALQRGEPDAAAAALATARRLAPGNSRLAFAAALVEQERGRHDSAAAHLRRAIERDPGNLPALYLLARIVEQEQRPGSVAEARGLMDQALVAAPDNFVGLLERARLAARGRDLDALHESLDRIAGRADTASFPIGPALDAVRSAAAAGDFARAATEVAFLETTLQPLPAYQDDRDAALTSPGRTDVLFTSFLRLPTPVARPAPPDTALTFVPETLEVAGRNVAWVRAIWLSEDVPLALAAGTADTLWLSTEPGHAAPFAFPGRSGQSPPWAGVAPLDYDHDFRVDLALAGPGGLRLLRQDASGTFRDVTAAALPHALIGGSYAGVWAADLDMEGDLDLVLAPVALEPVVLWNRGDGTFEAGPAFAGVTSARQFVWADLDGDGDPDATLLDADGRLHVFANQRSRPSRFTAHPLPDTLPPARAIAAADLDRDATFDLAVLHDDGTLRRLSLGAAEPTGETLGHWPGFSAADVASTRLFVADLDNNGDLDVVASMPGRTHVWLGAPSGLTPLPPLAVQTTALADIGDDGRLDLLGVSPDGGPHLLVNQGTRDYYSTAIRPRAAEVTGDRRINSFGIGGEIEIRAGLLYQKQPITGPVVQFGLGEHRQADVARIIWPNGTVQAEFNVSGINPTMVTRQRLKGSCPWVFTFDGTRMRFVTDFIWRTALGLPINAQGAASVIHSEDWIRIRGDQLAPRDGFYDVSITAELWETHYFDHVALMVVDHPEGTDVFVDERFRLPAPTPALHVVQPPRPVAWARDQDGRDVTDLIRARDGRFVDTFPLGPWQGVAAEHYVEVALGDDLPADGPVWLVAFGWVYPTDASINIAMAQGSHAPLRGLVLEVPDGDGGWATVDDNLGFPSGKSKTMLIPLEHVFPPGVERRLRLRTNMEVYWDEITWAAGAPDARVTTRRLLPSVADLRYRGFSRTMQPGRRAPEVPDYERVATRTQVWRDLVGFYTRFGDVRPLNEAVDDRYTIMNAGDELFLRFPAVPPPAPGWERDFVLIGDGWIKDGDFNSGFSMTVAPLPYHGLEDYSRPPGRLEDDPAYRRHPEDWKRFHTRYVTPREFHRALVPKPRR